MGEESSVGGNVTLEEEEKQKTHPGKTKKDKHRSNIQKEEKTRELA